MSRFGRARFGRACCVGLFIVAGCATQTQSPPHPLELNLQLTRAVGSPLTTGVPATRPATNDLIGLRVTWYAVGRTSNDSLLPLDAAATLTSAPLGSGAILPTGQATRAARYGGGLAARDWLAIATRQQGIISEIAGQAGSVAPGTTVRFASQSPFISIAISRRLPTPTTTTAPTTTTMPVPVATFAVSLATPNTHNGDAAAIETAYLEGQPLSSDTPYVLLFPSAAAKPWTAVAAYIEVEAEPVDSPSEVAAWRNLTGDRASSTAPATRPDEQISLRHVLDGLANTKDPRPALLYLADTTDARIAGDIILLADANLLGKLSRAVRGTSPATAAAVSWALNRTALLTLADAGSKAPQLPAMAAALTVHTGEVGRHPDTLTEIVNAVGNTADLQARLVGENFIELEDNAAGSRVRAYDWLKAQGRAPADYDPLGPVRQRRAAINRAIAAPGGTP